MKSSSTPPLAPSHRPAPVPVTPTTTATAPPQALQWRLHTVMSENNIRTATELTHRLQARGIEISKQQVCRLVAAERPLRLSIALLEALMLELKCSADALLSLSAGRKTTRRGQIVIVAPSGTPPQTQPAQPSVAPAKPLPSPARNKSAAPTGGAVVTQDASSLAGTANSPGNAGGDVQTPPRSPLALAHALGPSIHSLSTRLPPQKPESEPAA